MTPGELLEVLRKLARIAMHQAPTLRAGFCLTRTLRGQLQAVLVAVQRLAPIIELRGHVRGSLRGGEILVLDGQGRQSWPLGASECRISAQKLAQKDGGERPAIGGNVVHVEQEQVPILRQAQQADDEDRSPVKVEAVFEMLLELLQH